MYGLSLELPRALHNFLQHCGSATRCPHIISSPSTELCENVTVERCGYKQILQTQRRNRKDKMRLSHQRPPASRPIRWLAIFALELEGVCLYFEPYKCFGQLPDKFSEIIVLFAK